MSLDRDYHALIVSPRSPGPSPWQACACGWRWRRLRFDVREQCPACAGRAKLVAATSCANSLPPLISTTQVETAAAPTGIQSTAYAAFLHNSNETSYAPCLAADAQPVTSTPRTEAHGISHINRSR